VLAAEITRAIGSTEAREAGNSALRSMRALYSMR
jgi:hypothetical protein